MCKSLCTVCLEWDRRIKRIENIELLGIFEKLTNIKADFGHGDLRMNESPIFPYNRGRPPAGRGSFAMCYLCRWHLQKCRQFVDMAHRSNAILKDVHDRGLEVTPEAFSSLNVKSIQNLRVFNVKTIFIDPESTDEIQVGVKLETDEATKAKNDVDDFEANITDDANPCKTESDLEVSHYTSENLKLTNGRNRKAKYTCDICQKALASKIVLGRHVIRHGDNYCSMRDDLRFHRKSNTETLNCDICCKQFCSKHALKNHILAHCDEKSTNAKEKELSCDIFCESFESQKSIVHQKYFDHIETSNENGVNANENEQSKPVHPRLVCKKIYTKYDAFQKHMNAHNSEYKCGVCSESFTRKRGLRTHIRKHEQHPCDQCSKTFQNPTNLRNHIRTHTKDKPYTCETCQKSFSLQIYLRKHAQTHSDARYACAECSKTFAVKNSLRKHERTHKGKVYTHTCDRCAKAFVDSSGLKKHMLVHTGEKPHVCTECGKRFTRKFQLSEHSRVHTGERPFACGECGKTFTQGSSLSLHKRMHTGLRPYTCEVCAKTFGNKYNLQKHIRTHTGERPYACPLCAQTFTYNSCLHDHARRAHGAARFACRHCRRSFSRRSHLKRHAAVHLNEKQFITL